MNITCEIEMITSTHRMDQQWREATAGLNFYDFSILLESFGNMP